MEAQSTLHAEAIALAAQADLTLLTVEMLRAPQTVQRAPIPPWFETPVDTLEGLLVSGFGPDALAASESDVPSLWQALGEVRRLARSLDRNAWSDEYWRLFGSGEGCSLNQASYIRRDKGAILGDVCGFYQAFGWQSRSTEGERPDHLLCQLEFTAMLLAMAARAENDEEREIVHSALAQFARTHMHDWLPSACYYMIDAARLAYFGAVGQWLMLLWACLTRFYDWPVDPVSQAPLLPETSFENPYECGAPDLTQLAEPPTVAGSR